MTERICLVEGCGKPHVARDYCPRHYQQARNAGTLDVLPPNPTWHTLSEIDRDALVATCGVCGPDVPITVNSRGTYCRTRLAEKRRAKRRRVYEQEDRREALNKYHREYSRSQGYGLPRGGFELLYQAANGRCQICADEITRRDARVDHDHACCYTPTGRSKCGECIRGILCNPCNTLLGLAKDSPAILRAAAGYLVTAARNTAA